MLKNIREVHCDCGCDAVGNGKGWLSVYQLNGWRDDDPKVRGFLHFASFDCLKRWATKALPVSRKLAHAAVQVTPRGELEFPEFPTLYA